MKALSFVYAAVAFLIRWPGALTLLNSANKAEEMGADLLSFTNSFLAVSSLVYITVWIQTFGYAIINLCL